MPTPKRTIPGLKAIRTHSGKLVIPSADDMMIATLERQKKSLYATERAKLHTRFAAVDSQLRFIEAKKTEILCRLGLASQSSTNYGPTAKTENGSASDPKQGKAIKVKIADHFCFPIEMEGDSSA